MDYLIIKPYLHYKVSNTMFKGLHARYVPIEAFNMVFYLSCGNLFVKLSLLGLVAISFLK